MLEARTPYIKKLTDKDVLNIIDDYKNKNLSFTAYYKQLKNPLVSRSAYYKILTGCHYRHVNTTNVL